MPIRIEIANESLRAGLPAFAAKVWSFLAVKPFWIGIFAERDEEQSVASRDIISFQKIGITISSDAKS